MNHGQVRFANNVPLDYAAILVPFNGDSLVVNGTERHIPLAGLQMDIRSCYLNKTAAQALTNNTYYLIYACDIGGTLVLNADTTTHVTGTGGIEVNAGDATQTLVGCVFTLSGSIAPVNNNMLLGTWFNRYSTGLFVDPTGSTTSTSWYEPNSENRINFVAWADEAPNINANFTIGASQAPTANYAGVGVNQGSNADCYAWFASAIAGQTCPVAPTVPFASFPDGFNSISCLLKSGSSGNRVSFQSGSRLNCWWRG